MQLTKVKKKVSDVTYPGSSWFHVCNNGDVSVTVSTTKYGSNPAQTLVAKSTKFRFGDLHTVSFSFGLGGQVISVDGEVVATNLQNTQELGAGGTHSSAIDTPTLGESVPGFWQNNQWDGGFEGVVDSFRIYNRALTEAEVMELYNGKEQVASSIDLSLAITAPASVKTVEKATYQLTATNNGNATATGVKAHFVVPRKSIATVDIPKNCILNGRIIECALSDLGANQSATQTFSMTALRKGALSVVGLVNSDKDDTNYDDNKQSAVVSVK
ncbi:MAG: LamG-like jellyroll fold domain-containing protein [Methylococcaceae bacterium]